MMVPFFFFPMVFLGQHCNYANIKGMCEHGYVDAPNGRGIDN